MVTSLEFVLEWNLETITPEELAVQTQQMLRNISFGMNGLRQDLMRIQNVLFNPGGNKKSDETTSEESE